MLNPNIFLKHKRNGLQLTMLISACVTNITASNTREWHFITSLNRLNSNWYEYKKKKKHKNVMFRCVELFTGNYS